MKLERFLKKIFMWLIWHFCICIDVLTSHSGLSRRKNWITWLRTKENRAPVRSSDSRAMTKSAVSRYSAPSDGALYRDTADFAMARQSEDLTGAPFSFARNQVIQFFLRDRPERDVKTSMQMQKCQINHRNIFSRVFQVSSTHLN